MDIINKRINIVIKIISNYFYKNNIYLSSCLAQSYLLYKYILNQNQICTLIKGYIINNIDKVYYGHFWVEYNNIIYDIATETYLLDYELKYHSNIKNTRRILATDISTDILINYKNVDNNNFDIIRDESYRMCIENKFLEDVEKKAPFEIFNKIKEIHNLIIH